MKWVLPARFFQHASCPNALLKLNEAEVIKWKLSHVAQLTPLLNLFASEILKSIKDLLAENGSVKCVKISNHQYRHDPSQNYGVHKYPSFAHSSSEGY